MGGSCSVSNLTAHGVSSAFFPGDQGGQGRTVDDGTDDLMDLAIAHTARSKALRDDGGGDSRLEGVPESGSVGRGAQ